MAGATITPTEDQTYEALARWIVRVMDWPIDTPQLRKGFQNQVADPDASYVVISPGVKREQNFGARRYDDVLGQQIVDRNVTYSYQVDCYGQEGEDWASILSIAWRSMWGVDNMARGRITPLYAEAPAQMNIVNAQGQWEQRFMIRLFGQVNQSVGLPQDFFDTLDVNIQIPADLLP